ncbi:hypothetical protein H2200_010303 [Cladophialophora chaetospira]|uniref:Uncharacterized protein n=1 Tax=Cladophialophora chaetospira TaxID=386627 RepID=A0AA38X181_9EURO|nr:hypothetical protein H2200_010303 [Cladophialophora chaetospira]
MLTTAYSRYNSLHQQGGFEFGSRFDPLYAEVSDYFAGATLRTGAFPRVLLLPLEGMLSYITVIRTFQVDLSVTENLVPPFIKFYTGRSLWNHMSYRWDSMHLDLSLVALFGVSIFAPNFVTAQNNCQARLITCAAFQIDSSGTFDYELTYDHIPDGSVTSICGATNKALQPFGFGALGCHTVGDVAGNNGQNPSSNAVTFSTRIADSDAFDIITSTFDSVLQCRDSIEISGCTTVPFSSASRLFRRHQQIASRQSTVDILQNGGLMSKVGNSLALSSKAGTLILVGLETVSGTINAIPLNNDVALAVQDMA